MGACLKLFLLAWVNCLTFFCPDRWSRSELELSLVCFGLQHHSRAKGRCRGLHLSCSWSLGPCNRWRKTDRWWLEPWRRQCESRATGKRNLTLLCACLVVKKLWMETNPLAWLTQCGQDGLASCPGESKSVWGQSELFVSVNDDEGVLQLKEGSSCPTQIDG